MKILIVEDEPKTAAFLKELIAAYPNYTVVSTSDSLEAAQNLNLLGVPTKERIYQSSFLIRLRERIYPVVVSDIAFVYLENGVVYLYDFNGEKHPVLKTLDEFENVVSPQQFYRINRQMIINRQAIKDIETYHNQRASRQCLFHSTPDAQSDAERSG